MASTLPFPKGFGDGTGISAGHSDLVGRLNSMMGGDVDGFGLASKLSGGDYNNQSKIYVDPTSGDDHPANNGLDPSAPLKTFIEATKRLPVWCGGPPKIILKKGNHELSSAQDLGSMATAQYHLEGEYTEIESFVIDSLSVDRIVLNKAVGEAPWIVDELVGKFVEWYTIPPGVSPSYPDGFVYLYPVVANDTHSVTLAWAPGVDPFESYIPVAIGATIKIVQLGSIISNSTGITFGPMSSVVARYLIFDGTWVYPAENCSVLAADCQFKNSSYAVYTYFGGYITITRSSFHNCGRALALPSKSYGQMGNIYVENGSRVFDSFNGGSAAFSNTIATRNVTDVAYLREHSDFRMGGAKLWMKNTSYILRTGGAFNRYYESAGLVKLTGSENPGVNSYALEGGAGNVALTNKASAIEPDTASNAIAIGGTTFDLNTFRTTHGRNYHDAVKENKIFELP